jgi:hypothetical protein
VNGGAGQRTGVPCSSVGGIEAICPQGVRRWRSFKIGAGPSLSSFVELYASPTSFVGG